MNGSPTVQIAALVARALGFLAGTAVNTVHALIPIAAAFVVIWFFERRQGSDTSRYRRRHFAHDVAYVAFYDSGIFRVLGAALIYDAVQSRLGFLQVGLFAGLPIVVV